MNAAQNRKPLRILVIGYGNPGRTDDGLGPAVAARISELELANVSVDDPYQLSIEDSLEIAAHDLVWFVDSAKSGAEPFDDRPLQPASQIAFDSHHLTPETLLAITAGCCGAAPEARLIGVRGYEFGLGEALSPGAAANLEQAVAFLRGEICAQTGGPR
jgi:hydrogenase maturation protease